MTIPWEFPICRMLMCIARIVITMLFHAALVCQAVANALYIGVDETEEFVHERNKRVADAQTMVLGVCGARPLCPPGEFRILKL
jgi:hypothetical protein